MKSKSKKASRASKDKRRAAENELRKRASLLGDRIHRLGNKAYKLSSALLPELVQLYVRWNHAGAPGVKRIDARELKKIYAEADSFAELLKAEELFRDPPFFDESDIGVDPQIDNLDEITKQRMNNAIQEFRQNAGKLFGEDGVKRFGDMTNMVLHQADGFIRGKPDPINPLHKIEYDELKAMLDLNTVPVYATFMEETYKDDDKQKHTRIASEQTPIDRPEHAAQMALVEAVKKLVEAALSFAERRSSKLRPECLKLQVEIANYLALGVQDDFTVRLQQTLEGLWGESNTPHEGGGVKPGPKLSNAKAEQVTSGVNAFNERHFKTYKAAAKYVLETLATVHGEQWASGYPNTPQGINALAQCIRRSVSNAAKKVI